MEKEGKQPKTHLPPKKELSRKEKFDAMHKQIRQGVREIRLMSRSELQNYQSGLISYKIKDKQLHQVWDQMLKRSDFSYYFHNKKDRIKHNYGWFFEKITSCIKSINEDEYKEMHPQRKDYSKLKEFEEERDSDKIE